jgi:hypothetical protein
MSDVIPRLEPIHSEETFAVRDVESRHSEYHSNGERLIDAETWAEITGK